MKIGMVVAIPEEIGALLNECGQPLGTEKFPGYEVMKYKMGGHDLFVVGSGAGEIAAAAATQLLITAFGIDKLINFGVVGGLTEEMSLSNVAVVKRAVHYDFDASPFLQELVPAQHPEFPDVYIPADEELLKEALAAVPNLKVATIASSDRFINDPAFKKSLHEKYDADICDMESAGILLTCNKNNVPALSLKAVSDSVQGGEDEFFAMVHEASKTCIQVLMKILNS